MVLVGAYLGAIVVANLTVAGFGPAATIFNAFVLIGLDLTTRDALHERWQGRQLWPRMAALVATGSLVSWALNQGAGRIALASFVAFASTGLVDAATYHALRRYPFLAKANGSNVLAAATDSLLFPTLAFGALMPWIMLGQFAAKVFGGAVWSLAISAWRGRR